MYNELIKNFERIRSYMREFYVYGFKSRADYDKKSGRSYDNERRRVESYLGDYMGFRQSASGKNVFLSIDSRSTVHNPLFKAWKAKSFTDGDITLHFILLDILQEEEAWFTAGELLERIYEEYLCCFQEPMGFDESTVRKKLKEYEELGLAVSRREGKKLYYSGAAAVDTAPLQDALEFYSETGLCGVIGSYLLEEQEEGSCFSFKHHYITQTLDSEILYTILDAMTQRCEISFWLKPKGQEEERSCTVIPLKIYVSVQNGRQYIMGCQRRGKSIRAYRLDHISRVQKGEEVPDFERWREELEKCSRHIWGVICNRKRKPEYVEFTLRLGAGEEHIYRRLEREKRCGKVERLDAHTCRFTAEVYDTWEMVPWIRTFLCRIVSLDFSNRTVENFFKEDVRRMYEMYGICKTDGAG